MLCADFEDRLTDYLDGALETDVNRAFAEHAMRCPVCHDLLSEVKMAINACQISEPFPPPLELEAQIILQTMPDAAMSCAEFEECLTDYLDGFLPAPLFHRWERHAVLCQQCTELPGQVVRAIGACYTYISEARNVPARLHAKILQATLGTTEAEEIKAPPGARIAALVRQWLDPIVSPQLATVAAMLLVAVLVLTSTVSADGSISGMYRASLRLAEQTYTQGANSAVKSAALSGNFKQLADSVTDFIGNKHAADANMQQEPANAPTPKSEPTTKRNDK